MSGREFPKYFDGRRFYNPDAPQARGFLDVLQWKLSSRPDPSPEFISDVEPSTPPRRVESSELRITNYFGEPLDAAHSATRFQHFDGPNLVETSESCVLFRSEAPTNSRSADGRFARH